MKKLLTILICLTLTFSIASCGSSSNDDEPKTDETSFNQIVNIPDISNKSKEDVASIIGDPTAEEEETYTYLNDTVEIYYIDNMAARITVYADLPFTNDSEYSMAALNAIGLEAVRAPVIANDSELAFNNSDLKDSSIFKVSIFHDDKSIQYYYIITDESYDKEF